MILPVVTYGHPILRQKGALITRFTPELDRLIENMFETMYDAEGVGLAAQQVGQALQLTVIDIRGATERPSTLELGGQPADPASFMPLVLINPAWKAAAEPVAGPEGCLSFPEIFGEITRPESVEVTALGRKGEPIQFRCGGLLARAVQHEYDHLHGVLFIDRMEKGALKKLKPELDGLVYATKRALKKSSRKV